MTVEGLPPSLDGSNGAERDPFEDMYLGEAITKAHIKLLEARKKDLVLGDKDADGSHRHAPSTMGIPEEELDAHENMTGITDRYVSVLLVPSRSKLASAKIVSVALTFPTKPWDKAGSFLQELHQANLIHNAPGVFDETSSLEPRNVPTTDVFGIATNTNGETISFHLSPEDIKTPVSKDDIVKASPEARERGQYYDISDHYLTGSERADFLAHWFKDAEALKDILKDYEPFPFAGHAPADFAAAS